jgi:signal transduction histidine kinase
VLDPKMEELLRSQAAAGAVRIRTFLTGHPTGPIGDGTLGGCVRAAATHFTDLPLTLSIDLATDVQLEPAVADAVEQAIRTLLHNVRNHAHANKVVIHADTCGKTGWEMSVLDDGQGFDATVTPVGFGLGQQVHAALMAHGISASITSRPGEGTMVVLRTDPPSPT